jgi:NAD(P)-dependent dehydrogenase (short-subunit alcohol dehydrogenase family)
MINSIPLGRIGSPTGIGNLALFLASEGADFLTGQIFIVDGGECINTLESLI